MLEEFKEGEQVVIKKKGNKKWEYAVYVHFDETKYSPHVVLAKTFIPEHDIMPAENAGMTKCLGFGKPHEFFSPDKTRFRFCNKCKAIREDRIHAGVEEGDPEYGGEG